MDLFFWVSEVQRDFCRTCEEASIAFGVGYDFKWQEK